MTRLPTSHDDVAVDPSLRWSIGSIPWLAPHQQTSRYRVIIDNDFIGDPDDLYQVVHHLLSPDAETRLIVSSHLPAGDGWDPSDQQAAHGTAVVHHILARMGLEAGDRVITGAEHALADPHTAYDTPAARAIVAEALRDDDRPLFYAAGGGLTDLACALLLEPSIADRMTLVWIGGTTHPALRTETSGEPRDEYNTMIDPHAVRTVFGHSTIPVWQVPADTYRHAMMAMSEVRTLVRPLGLTGQYLHDELDAALAGLVADGHRTGDVYIMGDQPLVLLTALHTPYDPDPATSTYLMLPTPTLEGKRTWVEVEEGRPMRYYISIDNRLMIADMVGKLAELADWQAGR
ncbi:nucleoside hydrolase [Demequina sp.]|uniref:nucleoside hydrolase n=1 Tax=Demequina sp. TaxID=2050685 RepID=UPI003A88AF7F